MKKEMTLWYAVSKTGQGRIFTKKPERNEHFGIWAGEHIGFASELVMYMESEGFTLPDLRWSDEPAALTLTLGLG